MITQERLKELLDYCPETGVFTWKIKLRNKLSIGDVAGCLNKDTGYWRVKIDGREYLAHRLAVLWMTGEFPAEQIDHKDHVRTNNRWPNLREASPLVNQRNRSLAKHNTSGANGVAWSKAHGKWHSYIKAEGRTIHLGFFDDIKCAVAARKTADVRYGFHANHGTL